MENKVSSEQAHELLEFIENKWSDLVCNSRDAAKEIGDDPDKILYLPNNYITPNKDKFEVMFYWDSYFIIQALKTEKGRQELIRGVVDNFLFEVDTYGKALNANKNKWSTRSQIPYLALMVKDVYMEFRDRNWLKKAFDLIKKEYNGYWMDRFHLTSAGLNRYYDESGNDAIGEYKRTHGYKSCAESSWDMSPRFDEKDIHDLLPVDLNCNLYQYEKLFQEFAGELGFASEAEGWKIKAEKRKEKINELMWNSESDFFYDCNFKANRRKSVKSLASYQAMFAGLASKEQAEKLKDNLKMFETKGGLAACAQGYESADCQWDWPTVWAPLQYICREGLKKYGYEKEAEKISADFVKIVYDNWKRTGKIWEKYNGKTGDLDGISERYETQSGFGWTSAVAEVFIRESHEL